MEIINIVNSSSIEKNFDLIKKTVNGICGNEKSNIGTITVGNVCSEYYSYASNSNKYNHKISVLDNTTFTKADVSILLNKDSFEENIKNAIKELSTVILIFKAENTLIFSAIEKIIEIAKSTNKNVIMYIICPMAFEGEKQNELISDVIERSFVCSDMAVTIKPEAFIRGNEKKLTIREIFSNIFKWINMTLTDRY